MAKQQKASNEQLNNLLVDDKDKRYDKPIDVDVHKSGKTFTESQLRKRRHGLQIGFAAAIILSLGAGAIISNGVSTTKTPKTIATLDGNKYTTVDAYNSAKSNLAVKQVILNDLITKVLEVPSLHIDEPTNKEIQAEYDKQAKNAGGADQFLATLQQAGQTEDTYKQSIKLTLFVQNATKKYVNDEEPISNKTVRSTYEKGKTNYEVSGVYFGTSNADDAKKALADAQGGKSLEDIAKAYGSSTRLDSDSVSKTLNQADSSASTYSGLFDDLSKMKDGEVKSITDGSKIWIVKLNKKTTDNTSYANKKDKVRSALLTQESTDQSMQKKALKYYVQKSGISFKDKDIQSAFAQFFG